MVEKPYQQVLTAQPEHDPSEGPFVPEAHVLAPLDSTPPRRVGILKGLFGYWLLPGRLGPHLTCGSLITALFVSVLSSIAIVIAVGLFIAANMYEDPFYTTPSLRINFARFLGETIRGSGAIGFNPVPFAIIVGSPILLTLLGVAYGVLLLPWAQSGGGANALRRSVKNGLWCTTVIALIGGLALYLISDIRTVTGRMFASPPSGSFGVVHLIPFFGILLLVRASVLGASRFVAPKSVDDELMPRCEACGYNLVGLSVHSTCPECGQPVGESFEGGPRDSARNAFKSALSGRWRDALQLLKRLAFHRAIYETLPVYESRLARRVWWMSFAACAVIVEAGVMTTRLMETHDRQNTIGLTFAFEAILLAIFLMHTVSLFNLVWIGRGKHDIRDPRVSVAIGNFATPMLILPTAIGVVGLGAPTWLGSMIAGSQLQQTLHGWMDFWPIWATIILVLLVVSLGRWLSCTRYGLRHSRFANF